MSDVTTLEPPKQTPNIPVTIRQVVERMNTALRPAGRQVLWDAFRRRHVLIDIGKQGKVVDIADLSLKLKAREPYETIVG
jgi:hypothetical protein